MEEPELRQVLKKVDGMELEWSCEPRHYDYFNKDWWKLIAIKDAYTVRLEFAHHQKTVHIKINDTNTVTSSSGKRGAPIVFCNFSSSYKPECYKLLKEYITHIMDLREAARKVESTRTIASKKEGLERFLKS
jgi:hypothetical protein